VLTTFTSYGTVAKDRQFLILSAMRDKPATGLYGPEPDQTKVQQVLAFLQKRYSPSMATGLDPEVETRLKG